jgi:redox-sensitive bicupin YhaK (pirin superfamily)
VSLRVIAGQAFGARSPVAVFSPTLYCALELAAGARFVVTAEHTERAVYVVSGEVMIDGQRATRGQLAVLAPGLDVTLAADTAAQLMLLGGAPLGPRLLWWNLVSTARDKITAAQADWRRYAPTAGTERFAAVPGEHEFIPLPDK